MKILAFDTSSKACSVALLDSDKLNGQIKSIHKIAPKQHAKIILSHIDELLSSNSVTLNDLDAIAYGCGPGSFTGIRIASCLAQGLSLAKQIAIIKISSMAAIAQAAYLTEHATDLLVAIDARMQQVYWGSYQVNSFGNVELIGNEEVYNPQEIKLIAGKRNWLGVGDGWEVYKEELINSLGFKPAINSSILPTAEAILSLAKIKFEQNEWITTCDAIPHYLR